MKKLHYILLFALVGVMVWIFLQYVTGPRSDKKVETQTDLSVQTNALFTRIEGQVVDSKGDPVLGASVAIYAWSQANGFKYEPIFSSPKCRESSKSFRVTRSDGRFTIYVSAAPKLPPHEPLLQAQATAAGYQPLLQAVRPQPSAIKKGAKGATRLRSKSAVGAYIATCPLRFELPESVRQHKIRIVDHLSKAPIAGAIVSLQCADPSTGMAALYDVVANENGVACLQGLPGPGTSCMLVTSADKHTHRADHLLIENLPDSVDLYGLGRWSGTLHLLGSDNPVGGIVLRVWGAPDGMVETRSVSSGKFVIENLPVGLDLTYEIVADNYGLARPVPNVIIPPETLLLEQNVELELGFRVEGFVRNSHGVGIVNAHVLATCEKSKERSEAVSGYSISAVTDDRGSFHLGGVLFNAEWTLEVNHADYVSLRESAQVMNKDDLLEIVLRAGAAISGKVLYDKTMIPASGFWVRLQSSQPSEMAFITALTTDANGEFVLDRVPPGSYSLGALPNNSEPVAESKEDFEAQEGEDYSVVILVPSPGYLEIHAKFDRSIPFADHLLVRARDVDHGTEQEYAVVANADKIFTIGPLRPRSYSFLASVKDAEPIQSEPIVIPSGGAARLDLEFRTGRILYGRVVNKTTGSPVEGAKVSAYRYPEGELMDVDPGPPSGTVGVSSATSGPDGSFRVTGLPHGKPLRIDVSHPVFAPWSSGSQFSQQAPPDSEFVIRLVPGANLAVDLTRGDGGSIENVNLVLSSETPGIYKGDVSTDAQGHASFENLPPGRYELWFISPPALGKEDGHTVTKMLQISSGETTNEKIDISVPSQ